ncbi:MAG: fasciclin domain-containing protein [Phycisphaerae bacterium]|nr:fasciclin domain-containing protein [Phycisphaerae bacterium]
MKRNTTYVWATVVFLALLGAWLPWGKKDGGNQKDIVATAKSAGNFDTLVKALQKADLVDTLKGDGPFTVFAPTDDAFDQLPEGTLDNLLKPENKEQLKSILTYHVVSDEVMAADVAEMDTAETVNGETLTIQTVGETVMVDGAKVIKTDIKCTNGVIHAIDKVLMPN